MVFRKRGMLSRRRFGRGRHARWRVSPCRREGRRGESSLFSQTSIPELILPLLLTIFSSLGSLEVGGQLGDLPAPGLFSLVEDFLLVLSLLSLPCLDLLDFGLVFLVYRVHFCINVNILVFNGGLH